jgi:hypothetical protein
VAQVQQRKALLVVPAEQDIPVQFLAPAQHMLPVVMVMLVVLVLEFILQSQELVVAVPSLRHFRKVVEMES